MFFFFQIFSGGKKTLREQAGTGGTHQPELTIFWDFYFTEGGGQGGGRGAGGVQNMEGEREGSYKIKMNVQK